MLQSESSEVGAFCLVPMMERREAEGDVGEWERGPFRCGLESEVETSRNAGMKSFLKHATKCLRV